jgi:F-type H+-transporting ATPase subunit a
MEQALIKPSFTPEVIATVGNFPITNSLLVTLFISSLIIVGAVLLKKKLKLSKPNRIQNMIEMVFEGLLDLIDGVTGNREQTRKFFPLVATIFIFVILINWIEIVPGLGTIGMEQTHHGEKILAPFIRSASADLNLTLMLSLVAVSAAQFMGITALGIKKYIGKFLINPFKKPYFVGTFVGILEIISEFAKIISFSFRLFGNIFAGEVLLTVMLILVPIIIPLPFLFLEIFVGFIQALVFSMLTLVFMKMATEAH